MAKTASEAQRDMRDRRRAKGLCIMCGGPRKGREKYAQCVDCREANRQRRYNAKLKELAASKDGQ